ncbi:hypothetical protein B9Y63_02425 [Stenotrophomonas maltophilia]|nr:hypothetical protein B9Y63_02425 [Stenotrophomonas maltophilia]
MAWIYRVDQGRHLPEQSTKVDTHQVNTPFRQIAANCRRRGGSGCGSVRGMDAAAKPPRMGLRRLPQPDPPRHPSIAQLLTLTLTLILQVQGCKPCRTNPPPTKVGRPARQRRTILEPMTLSGRAAS